MAELLLAILFFVTPFAIAISSGVPIRTLWSGRGGWNARFLVLYLLTAFSLWAFIVYYGRHHG